MRAGTHSVLTPSERCAADPSDFGTTSRASRCSEIGGDPPPISCWWGSQPCGLHAIAAIISHDRPAERRAESLNGGLTTPLKWRETKVFQSCGAASPRSAQIFAK